MKSNTICTVLDNVRKLFAKHNIESAVLDAQIIIEHVLEKDRVFLLSHPDTPVSNKDCLRIDSLAARRAVGEPIAYLTGKKEFYGYDFFVNKNVLIPRPETEHLVESATKYLNLRIKNSLKIIDIGTGSGCIVVSLIKSLSHSASQPLRHLFYATEISAEALEVAKMNSAHLLFDSVKQVENAGNEFSTSSNNKSLICHSEEPKNLRRSFADTQDDNSETQDDKRTVHFLESDLFLNPELPEKFDLILANLPYVPKVRTEDLGLRTQEEKATDFEPQSAIFAEDNGASIIKNFLEQGESKLDKNGMMILELDPRNAKEIENFAKETYPNRKVKLTKDYAGHDRYLEIK